MVLRSKIISLYLKVLLAQILFFELIVKLLGLKIVYLAPVYMFTPFIATVISLWKYSIGFNEIGINLPQFNRWTIISWFTPPIICIGVLLIGVLTGKIDFKLNIELLSKNPLIPQKILKSPVVLLLYILITGLIAGITINTLFALGEEIGWRGLMYNELKKFGIFKASLIIGIIWGLWHAPLIIEGYNYPRHPYLGVMLFTIFTTLLTPLMLLIREKTASVIPPAIFHGTLNAFAGLPFMFNTYSDPIIVGVQGVFGIFLLLILNFILFKFYSLK